MTARTGLSDLILELRGMVEAGTADYAVGTISYWSDDHLQNVLDLYRTDVIFEQLGMYPTVTTGGSSLYKDYRSSYGFLEATSGGTAILYLQDGIGSVIGSTNYTPDYRRGQFQFSADQGGTAYYLTGRSYDLNAAAADVWRKKAAHYAPTSFNFSTDNHSVSKSQVYEHCVQMAEHFENQGGNSLETVTMWRSDLC